MGTRVTNRDLSSLDPDATPPLRIVTKRRMDGKSGNMFGVADARGVVVSSWYRARCDAKRRVEEIQEIIEVRATRKMRTCLAPYCDNRFWSEGPGHRYCSGDCRRNPLRGEALNIFGTARADYAATRIFHRSAHDEPARLTHEDVAALGGMDW